MAVDNQKLPAARHVFQAIAASSLRGANQPLTPPRPRRQLLVFSVSAWKFLVAHFSAKPFCVQDMLCAAFA
jgi:hypothetical protein